MIGTASAIDNNGHIKLDLLNVIVKSKRALKLLDVIFTGVVLAFAVYFLWSGISYTIQMVETGERTIATNVPMVIPQSSILVGAALLVIHLSGYFYRNFLKR